MIEGLGKGVKYSLFVANAIIFVSVYMILIYLRYILKLPILKKYSIYIYIYTYSLNSDGRRYSLLNRSLDLK